MQFPDATIRGDPFGSSIIVVVQLLASSDCIHRIAMNPQSHVIRCDEMYLYAILTSTPSFHLLPEEPNFTINTPRESE